MALISITYIRIFCSFTDLLETWHRIDRFFFCFFFTDIILTQKLHVATQSEQAVKSTELILFRLLFLFYPVAKHTSLLVSVKLLFCFFIRVFMRFPVAFFRKLNLFAVIIIINSFFYADIKRFWYLIFF